MNFFEAMRALESGKTVFSHYSGFLYKLIDGGIVGRHGISNNYWEDASIMPKEFKGQWAIYEEESKQPEEEHNLLWALKQLKAGKKVTCSSLRSNFYLKMNKSGLIFSYDGDNEVMGLVLLNEYLAEDTSWEVV